MSNEKEEDNSSVECSECIKTALVSKPRIAVWSALDARKRSKANSAQQKQSSAKQTNSSYITYLIIGLIISLYGISTFIWKPYDIFMSERLEMRPGFPPYEWWVSPPDEVRLSVYVFNITNSDEFMRGTDKKLNLEEIGPIIYSEKLTHTDVVFHPNSTMTYTATRAAVYLPEYNSLDLNSIIYIPNLAVLGMASYLWNASFTMKFGFNMLIAQAGSKPLEPVKIKDYLWNLTDPVVKTARTLAPHLVPKENFGVLNQIYDQYSDERSKEYPSGTYFGEYSDKVTVLIGRKNGPKNFFKVDKYNGSPGFNAWRNETCDSVQGSTEGVDYHQEIDKDEVLWYLRKAFCRAAPLYFTGEHVMSGMNIFKFELSNRTFDRPSDGSRDCFQSDGIPELPAGLTDASPCYHYFPIASSLPHFMLSDPVVLEKIDGLKPNYEKHQSNVYLEPNTGVPFTAVARIQSNLVIRPIKSGFSKLKRFFNMSLPMFWAEYKQQGLPTKITALTYFTVIIVANYQIWFSVILMIISSILFYVSYIEANSKRRIKNAPAIYSSLPLSINDTKSIS